MPPLPETGGDSTFYAQATGDLSGVINAVDLLIALVAGFYFSRLMDSFPFWRDWNPGTLVKRTVFIALTALVVGLLAGLKQILLLYWDSIGPIFQAVLVAGTAVLATQIAFEMNKIASAVGAKGDSQPGTDAAKAEWGKVDLPPRG